MPFSRWTAIALFVPAALLAGCAEGGETGNASAAMTPAGAGNSLAAAENQSWINLSGTVVSTKPDSFILDYGSDTVTVEMDDWDWYREGSTLAAGDPVVVTGKVDQDLWDRKSIEASSVFVKDLNTYFYASGADEEDLSVSTVYVAPVRTYADSTGYVTAVEGREFTLGSDTGAIRVDTSQMTETMPQVAVGDRLYVWGDLDIDARERSELMAKGIVELTRDRTKTS